MAKISHKAGQVPQGKVGVESLWGFGDLCFNIPLIQAIARKYHAKVDVVAASRCKDALKNIPSIGKVYVAEQLNHGIKKLKSLGYTHTFQITQNVKFYEFVKQDPQHSLVDTPLRTAEQLGITLPSQRPVYVPSHEELQKATEYLQGNNFRMTKSFGKPLIAIEAVYKSIQSWAKIRDIAAIVNAYSQTHHILWLSNEGAPSIRTVDNMLHFSRRECIAALQHVEHFYSVGSGFFCAALGLPASQQPPKITCLWKDELYRYEKPLNKFRWHPDLTWVHNREELDQCLAQR